MRLAVHATLHPRCPRTRRRLPAVHLRAVPPAVTSRSRRAAVKIIIRGASSLSPQRRRVVAPVTLPSAGS